MQPGVSLSRHSRVFGLQSIKANSSGFRKTRQQSMQFSTCQNFDMLKIRRVKIRSRLYRSRLLVLNLVLLCTHSCTTAVLQCTQLQPGTSTGGSSRRSRVDAAGRVSDKFSTKLTFLLKVLLKVVKSHFVAGIAFSQTVGGLSVRTPPTF
jgi:hypothetical protein